MGLKSSPKCIHFIESHSPQAFPDEPCPQHRLPARTAYQGRPCPGIQHCELHRAHRRSHHHRDHRASPGTRHQARRAEDRRHLQGLAHHRSPGPQPPEPRQARHAGARTRRACGRAQHRRSAPGLRGAADVGVGARAAPGRHDHARTSRPLARPPGRRTGVGEARRRVGAHPAARRLPRRARAHARQRDAGRAAGRPVVALLADRADVPVGAFRRTLVRRACSDRRRARETRRAHGTAPDGRTPAECRAQSQARPGRARPRGRTAAPFRSRNHAMTLTLTQLNAAPASQALDWLDGLYEHSPWIAELALAERPFRSLAHLKLALVEVVRHAGRDRQLALVRAHPELAGKAMVAGTLTAESTHEQSTSGLTGCTPQEFAKIQQLNADYNAKFGWPFILAVRGPRGLGLSRTEIIATFERRLQGHPDFELAECLRNIHRIAEIRLNDKFGVTPALGNRVWDWAESLAQHTDPGYAELGQLTVTYLTDAHRACAQRLSHWMRECGFDEVSVDAVGNVVGIYHANDREAKRLLTGSHYDTVRNGGKYDGRLGILVPMACVRELHAQGRRLPYGFEVIGFAEEEGQRYKATFLGSGALVGQFNPAWLEQ